MLCDTPGDGVTVALEGDDRIETYDGHDPVCGSPDSDALFGDWRDVPGDDMLIGGPGDDILHGQEGIDVLEGGPHNDELFGGECRDGGPHGLRFMAYD